MATDDELAKVRVGDHTYLVPRVCEATVALDLHDTKSAVYGHFVLRVVDGRAEFLSVNLELQRATARPIDLRNLPWRSIAETVIAVNAHQPSRPSRWGWQSTRFDDEGDVDPAELLKALLGQPGTRRSKKQGQRRRRAQPPSIADVKMIRETRRRDAARRSAAERRELDREESRQRDAVTNKRLDDVVALHDEAQRLGERWDMYAEAKTGLTAGYLRQLYGRAIAR